MNIETLEDVLQWTTAFHKQLGECIKHCKDKNTDERARMMLDYLSDHEAALTRIIGGFESTGEKDALNTWCIEYIQKQPIVQHVHCDEPFASLDAEQIMTVIVDQHQQVINLYRYLVERADIPAASELLEMVGNYETQEIMRMNQSANRFHDM